MQNTAAPRQVLKSAFKDALARTAQASLRISHRILSRLSPGLADTELSQLLGVEVIQKHFYSPIPDSEDFGPGFWDCESEMVGVAIDPVPAITLIRDAFPPYLAEFRSRFPVERPPDGEGYFLINGVYMAVDAHVYYCLMRHIKPSRVIEIGAGQSTILAAAAAETNGQDDGTPCIVTAIEPYPSSGLKDMAKEGKIELLAEKVQNVKLDLFQDLHSGDFLFIDSSHVLREGNDVQYEYLEILPRLKAGVYVHVHDISLPRRYPKVYFDNRLYWNEQYLLQAYLMHNGSIEIIWPGNYLMLKHPALMLDTFPEIDLMRRYFPQSEPTAFWMRAR